MIILAVLLDIGKKFMISVTLVLFTLELHQAGFSILLTSKCLVASLLAPVISQQFGSYWVIFGISIAKMVFSSTDKVNYKCSFCNAVFCHELDR